MARYIEETEIYKLVEPHGTAKVHCSQIDELPRSDVVPKSEVDSIITLNSQLEAQVFEQRKEIERLKKYNTDVAFKHYNDGKAELAREIFEEIEKLHLHITNEFDLRRYEALKKKYTEGEDKPAATEEKYFSPEDVRKMTNQEVREKYTAIRKSMERW